MSVVAAAGAVCNDVLCLVDASTAGATLTAGAPLDWVVLRGFLPYVASRAAVITRRRSRFVGCGPSDPSEFGSGWRPAARAI